jgi:hypothetical protein
MHIRDENKLNSENNQFDKKKARLGWETGKKSFDCNGLEKGRAGQGWNNLPSVAAPR